MSVRIQLKRDLSQNWTLHNPILLNGEIGIETDTLKFKIGNGGRWNDLTSYAFKPGQPNGMAVLNSEGKIAISQLPDSFSINADIASALALLSTTNLPEGTNKYFTNARAISAVGTAISDAIALEVTSRNQAIATAKSEAISTAASDATSKANAAQAAAISAASADATSKANAAQAAAVISAGTATDSKIATYSATVNGAISSAVSAEAIARNAAITTAMSTSLSTSNISEGTNLYFTNARAVAALASGINTNSIPEGTGATPNLYFTNARAVAALNTRTSTILANALDAVDALDLKVNGPTGDIATAISSLVSESDRNIASGFAGLDSNGLILTSVIPASIARKTDIDTAVSALVDSAPGALNTLNELATAITNNQSGITTLTNSIASKLSSLDAAATYATLTNVALKAPIANPTFTGTVTIPAGASISGYATTTALTAVDTKATNALAATTSLTNTLSTSGYLEEADRDAALGFAGLNSSSNISPSVIANSSITNAKLVNSQITINGTAVSLGGTLSVTAGYSNSNTGISSNVISYGSSATPPSGTAVGDIYIQY